MKKIVSAWLICFSQMACCAALAEDTPVYYYQNDARHLYQVELLERVLELTNEEFGQARAVHKSLPHHRAGVWALSTGDVDVTWFTSTQRNVSTFLPIEIPITQGLIGYRPFLTTKGKQAKFKQIHNLSELKKSTVTAFGRHWDSLMIITTNGLPYRTSPYYQELFEMVATEQVDYMPRGLTEIEAELEEQLPKYPNLVVSDEVAIYIPTVIYFYVSVNRQDLAERIETGLQLALADGSFRRLFDKHFAKSIARIAATSPRVITLYNPLLPADTSPIKADWWVPAQLRSVITEKVENKSQQSEQANLVLGTK